MASRGKVAFVTWLLLMVGAGAFWWGGLSGVTAVQAGHEGRVPFDTSGWKTNFKKHSVPLSEFMGGGPPKDGIPAIDKPTFETVAAADKWLKPKEPVIRFDHNGDIHAYPLQILIWHEIVNDTVGGLPVIVTF